MTTKRRSPFAQAMLNLNAAIKERDECADALEQARRERRAGLRVDVEGWEVALRDHKRTVERLEDAVTLTRGQRQPHDVMQMYISDGYGYRCETCYMPIKCVDRGDAGLVWVHEDDEQD